MNLPHITDLKPFKSMGPDLFTRKGLQNLVVVDRMSSYIFVEKINKHIPCKSVTQKFRLLILNYGMPCDVRYDKGPQVSKKIEDFLKDIYI